jgi:ankyrin repeat protein
MSTHPTNDPEFAEFSNAIKSGSVERVENILKVVNASMVNRLDTQLSQPPLHFAVISNEDDISVEIIKLLIRHGANYRFKDSIEQTILFYVCREGKIKCAEVLLSQGLNLDEVDKYGQTPIFYAASENQL